VLYRESGLVQWHECEVTTVLSNVRFQG
jgi:hypothetical protein